MSDDEYDCDGEDVVSLSAHRAKRDATLLADALAKAKRSLEAREAEPARVQSGPHECRRCKSGCASIFPEPGESRRTVCGKCQGEMNREVCDRMAAAVKTLKNGPNKAAEAFLKSQGYEDTVRYLLEKFGSAAPGKRGGFE